MKFSHTILVIDDEKSIFSLISTILKSEDIPLVYSPSGEQGLSIIESAETPFSIIIADQILGGMKGHEFFEEAKEISPDSARFLITGYSDMDILLDAVNKGSIHRYISKPIESKEFLHFVREGLEIHEKTLEHQILLSRGKKNNKKLYDLTKDLNHTILVHKKLRDKLNGEIAELNQKLKTLNSPVDEQKDKQDWERVETLFQKHGLLEAESINRFLKHTCGEFFELFQRIARRNGFELSDIL